MAGAKKTYYGHRARLREKFTKSSLSGLHDYEMMELLLTYVIPRVDVKPYAKELLKKFGSIGAILKAPREEVAAVPGIGCNASVLISLVKELTETLLGEVAVPLPSLNQPQDVARFVSERIGSNGEEALYALYLNTKNRPLALETVFEGRPDLESISSKEIVKKALQSNARSVIFVHHGAALSAAEENLERPLAMALRSVSSAIDVVVHDYIILSGDAVLSAQEEGWFGKAPSRS